MDDSSCLFVIEGASCRLLYGYWVGINHTTFFISVNTTMLSMRFGLEVEFRELYLVSLYDTFMRVIYRGLYVVDP